MESLTSLLWDSSTFFSLLLSMSWKKHQKRIPQPPFFLSYSSIQTWPAVFVSTLLPHSLEDSSSSWVFRQHTVCGLCVLSYKRQSHFIVPICSLQQEWEAGLDCPLPHYALKLAWATVNGRLVARTRLSSLMMGFSLRDKRNKETDHGVYSGGCYEFSEAKGQCECYCSFFIQNIHPYKKTFWDGLEEMGWLRWNVFLNCWVDLAL